jgi:N-acetylglucosamine-6-phosphate deacetylase
MLSVSGGTIVAGTLLSEGRSLEGWVETEGERIALVGLGRPPRHPTFGAALVAPGLCDIQVNGTAGYAVADGPAALKVIDDALMKAGVTTYLPTLITMPTKAAEEAVRTISERVRNPLSPAAGIHLEGPFLNEAFRGVHDARFLLPNARVEPSYYRAPEVRRVTIAPDLPGAMDLIRTLRSRRVLVSIGHTGASAKQAMRAAAMGAKSVTHLFNGMAPVGHHDPSAAGWALGTPGVHLTLIADGLHVDPLVLRLVARAAGARVSVITDSTPAAGAPDGAYSMCGVAIRKVGDRVSDTRGRLAGGGITLDEGVRRWARFGGMTLARAWVAGYERPARLIGIRAGLRPGAFADLVLLDEEATVRRVMRRGRWVG